MRALVALAACLAAPAPLTAQMVRVVTLDTRTITPRFTTTSPVVDVVIVRAPTAGTMPRVRYRRRARAAVGSCALRMQLTSVPQR